MGSCQIGALTAVVQVVVPINTVANLRSPLESPLDITVVLLMVILGRGPLCQIPYQFQSTPLQAVLCTMVFFTVGIIELFGKLFTLVFSDKICDK